MFSSEEFEYKYIISHENLDDATWENGDNRKVDLSNIEGGVVVIEDQRFNAVGEETKVLAQLGPILPQDYSPEEGVDCIVEAA